MSPERQSDTAVAVGLGSNLGDRRRHLASGVRYLRRLLDVQGLSAIYESQPVGYAAQGPFLNACLVGRTTLTPYQLLAELKHAEQLAGRRAGGPRYGPRVLDLDLLLYGETSIEAPDLVVPHARLRERAFVLVPLRDIAADWRVPGHDGAPVRTVRELAAAADAEGVTRTLLKIEDDE